MTMMARLTLAFLACFTTGYDVGAFVASNKVAFSSQAFGRCIDLNGSHQHDDNAEKDQVVNKQALSVGALVEFTEKGRLHFGKIKTSEHKSNGGARYNVADSNGKLFSIADKAVTYAIPPLTNERGAEQLFAELTAAQEASEKSLQKKLDISLDLLEMAWEDAASNDLESHELTPKSFIQLIHSHAASKVEAYMAWRFLKMEHAHVFFTELKQNGRVVAFKAKTGKAVEAAKAAFCSQHQDDIEFCLV